MKNMIFKCFSDNENYLSKMNSCLNVGNSISNNDQ